MSQHLLASDFSSAAPHLSSLHKTEELGLLWIRPCLQGMLWLVRSFIQTIKASSMTAIRLFGFLVNGVHGIRTFPLLHNLAVGCRGPSSLQQPSWFFYLKWETCNSSLTWIHRGLCRVINWPNFKIVVSQRIGRPEERARDGEWLVHRVQHTNSDWRSSLSSLGSLCHPKTITTITSKTTGLRSL